MHKLLPMRVLIINTSERIGGAAIAASRLMESLKNNGIKAKMLVRDKQTDQISVVRLKSNWLQVWKFMCKIVVHIRIEQPAYSILEPQGKINHDFSGVFIIDEFRRP